MLCWGQTKEHLIGHLNYQIKQIKEIGNAPLYAYLKPNIKEYIKRIEHALKDAEETPEESIGWFELENYDVSYGYNNNDFITKIRKRYAESNFNKNCSNIMFIYIQYQLGKIEFTEEEKNFLDKFYSDISENNDIDKFNETLKSDVLDDIAIIDEELESIKWFMSYFWDRIFTEEELLHMIKSRKNIEEDFLIGEEQIKKDNAFRFYSANIQNENFTLEQNKYARNLHTIAYMYYKDKDIAIDEKYIQEIFYLVTKKKYNSEDIVELIKNSTTMDRLRVHLILEINEAKAKLKKLEKNSLKRDMQNTENYSIELKWQISFTECINAMSDALDMLI